MEIGEIKLSEHPSLKVSEQKKESALARLAAASSEISRVREAAAAMQSSAEQLEGNLQSLDAVELLADMQRQLTDIQTVLTDALAKVTATASAEAELLQKLSGKIDEI